MNLKSKMHGFNLVELMISIALGLLLIAAFGYLYMSSKNAFRAAASTTELQQSASYALEFMSKDLRNSGNFGCLASSGFKEPLNPFKLVDLTKPVAGLDLKVENMVKVLPGGSGFTPPVGVTLVTGSDVITILSASPSAQSLTTSSQTDKADRFVMIASNPLNLNTGSVVGLGDCEVLNVFKAQVSGGGPFKIEIDVSTNNGIVKPGNTVGFAKANKNAYRFKGTARLMQMYQTSYFVGEGTVTKEPGLFRVIQVLRTGVAPLVDRVAVGVTKMTVVIGGDLNAVREQAVTQYVPPTFTPSILYQPDQTRIASLVVSLDMQGTEKRIGTDTANADSRITRKVTQEMTLRNSLVGFKGAN